MPTASACGGTIGAMPYEIRQGDIPGIQLRCDRRFGVSAATLWRWLSEPARMRRWLAEQVEEDPGEVRLTSRAEDGSPLVERGRTVERRDGRLWILAFERLDDGWEMATELRFELTPGEDSRLTVLQRGFERLSLSRCLSVWELYLRRWRQPLAQLSDDLEADPADSG